MHPELAAEQAHVDRAYDRLEELERRALALAEEERTEYSRTFAGRLERDVREHAGLRRRASLRLGSLNLCFGRIDCEGGATYHLGRVAVADEDQEPLIVDWRAPIAEPFYRATPADPLGLRRRRHLLTKGRKVLRLDDEVFGRGGSGAGADEEDLVLVGEAALLDALRRARTGRMGDIVSTIQAEQDRIIRAPLNGLVVVQGGPGTGKTAVALHRAAYLLYTHRFPLEEMGVLFVGPNPVFLRYVERVLPTLGESGCRMVTADDLVDDVAVGRQDAPDVVRLKGDVRMAAVVAAAVRSRQRPLRRAAVVPFGAYELKLGPRASAAIVEQAVAIGGRHNERRPLVERLVLDHLVRQYGKAVARAERAGLAPRGLDDAELRDALRRTREVRRLFDRLWPMLTPSRLLVDLFGVPALLEEAAADGLLTETERDLLVRARPAPGEEVTWSVADLPLLDEAAPWLGPVEAARAEVAPKRSTSAVGGEDIAAIVDRALADALPECPTCGAELTFVGMASEDWRCEACDSSWRSADVLSPAAAVTLESLRGRLLAAATERAPEAGPELRTYGHVVVDEAQDLSPMAWRMLARRCPSGSMTIVGDLGQASGHWAPRSWDEVTALVPAPRADVVELTVNYRTPGEVMALAARVLAEARPDLTPARSVREAGVGPRAVPVDVAAGEALVARAVAVAEEESAAVVDGKVAVICPEALLPAVAAAVGEPADGDLLAAPVSALTLEDAKGLEFDAVVVVEPAAIAAEHPHGLGALYVALTRTTTRLALVHAENLPAALAV